MLRRLQQNHFVWHQGPMIVWSLTLFTLSSIPGQGFPSWNWLSHDKLIHVALYVVLAFTVHRAITHQTRFPLLAQRHSLSTFVIVSLFGASDELHQYFVPNRLCSLYDWIADSVGALLMILFDFARTKAKTSAVAVDCERR